MALKNFTLPPDTRAVGTGNPPVDVNGLTDAASATQGVVLNVMNAAYSGGADPTGVSDSTAAIQAALNTATPGQVVYAPAGTYKTSATLTVPLGVAFEGDSQSFGVPAGNYGIGGLALQGTIIAPGTPFTNSSGGAGVILMQATGGVQNGGQRLENITIDGSNAPIGNNMHGVLILDAVACVTLRDVTVYGAQNLGGDGLHAVASPSHPPDLINMFSCHWAGMNGWGVSMSGAADSYINSCEATGCASGGWTITNCNNTRFVGCKGEQSSAGPGWLFTALGGFTGIVHVLACTSQFNDQDGFKVTGSGTGTYQLVGCSADSDGTNGGGGGGNFAGLRIASFAGTLLADGFTGRVTGSSPSPQYGLRLTSSSGARVTVSASLLAGSTAALSDDGSASPNLTYGPGCAFSTGTSGSSPTVYEPGALTAGSSAGNLVPAGRFDLADLPAGATGTTVPRYAVTSNSEITAVSGTPYARLIFLLAGCPVNNISFFQGSGAGTGPTHGWFALADSSRVVRAVTADVGSGTNFGTANTCVTLPVTASYTPPSTSYYYLVACQTVSAGTVANWDCATALTQNIAGSVPGAPAICGTVSTSLTTPPSLGSTLASISAQATVNMFAFTT